ncbi:MAG: gamma-glutamyl-gamma-aminobutyrate hydrolase family protein [Acidimicrobiales bacterium]
MTPLIGLPGRRKKGDMIVGNPDILAGFDLDLYYADYARAVLEAGGLPVHIPMDIDAAAIVERLDGILLPGGADIDPQRYGHELDGSVDTEDIRDVFEHELIDGAIALDIPLLGICRGIQMINVHAGGTLHQDVPPHARFDDPTTTLSHEVTFEVATTIGGLYGERREVNSLHHQTIDELGEGLVVSARAPDGTIEAIEATNKPIIAVQWHPEMLPTRSADPVFSWLVESAR